MKHVFITSLFLFVSNILIGQVTFTIDDFSEQYIGKVFVADTSQVASKGWVGIYDKKTGEELIKLHSDVLVGHYQNSTLTANMAELPYGEHSIIMYNDYNFDGIKDFALMDGDYGCYCMPSFSVFLATKDGFRKSEEFTELTYGNCGMFDIDYDNKTIATNTKSGCCWHQYWLFKVKYNKPYPIKVVTEKHIDYAPAIMYTEENLVNGKMEETTYYKLVEEQIEDVVLSFSLKNGKKMFILESNGGLYYAFMDIAGKSELFIYGGFEYSEADNSLAFENYNTRYVIYEDKIVVKMPNKIVELKSVSGTKTGGLKKLKEVEYYNVENI